MQDNPSVTHRSIWAKFLNVQSLLWLALALALLGSLYHLAYIYTSINGNAFLGWLQAIAIDVGLFALAYRAKQDDGWISWPRIGLVLFVGISIYGNLSYGILATTGELPWILSVTQPGVLAASLPVLVLFLAEMLNDSKKDVDQTPVKDIAKTASKHDDFADKMQGAKKSRIDERRKKVKALHEAGADAKSIAKEVGVKDVRTIKNDIKKITDHNDVVYAIHKNGDGKVPK